MIIGAPAEIGGVTVGQPVVLQTLFVGSPSSLSGSAQIQYVHTQTMPAAVWTVIHNLGRRPSSISVFSLDFTTQWDEFGLHHVDINQLYISADVAFPGIALIE